MAYPERARRGSVSHILAEKRGVSFTLFQKMHENAIFSPIRGGGVRRVRPMLDPSLTLRHHIVLIIMTVTLYCIAANNHIPFVSRTIISYICLSGHLGGVSEIQTSLDVSGL